MESKAKILGHPIHPILIVFPVGLLLTGLVFDILYLVFGNPEFPHAAYWMIAGGLLGGLAAAVFGAIDWFAIPADTRAKRIGLLHGVGNVVVVLLFAVAFYLRINEINHVSTTFTLILELLGAAVLGVTGWLGAELVDRLGIGVDRGANPNAPSSLSGLPASDGATARANTAPAGTRR
jgi:uncharacterized membrane protein